MASQNIPISKEKMINYFVEFGSKWERLNEVTDDTMIETDYGYNVDVYDDKKASGILYNACLDIYEPGEETNYTDMQKISHLIRNAIQSNGNILVCSCSKVQELCDKQFDIRSCDLSTQILFYYIVVKSGWTVTAMGLADDCPFTGSDEFEDHFCLVRDGNDSALASLNDFVFEKSHIGLRLGKPLRGIFAWKREEEEIMEKFIDAMEHVIRSHDELDKLLERRRRVAVDLS